MHAVHIDVSVAREQVQARLAAALAAGGRIVDESEVPGHWTLADRAGNRVCVCPRRDRSTQPHLDAAEWASRELGHTRTAWALCRLSDQPRLAVPSG